MISSIKHEYKFIRDCTRCMSDVWIKVRQFLRMKYRHGSTSHSNKSLTRPYCSSVNPCNQGKKKQHNTQLKKKALTLYVDSKGPYQPVHPPFCLIRVGLSEQELPCLLTYSTVSIPGVLTVRMSSDVLFKYCYCNRGGLQHSFNLTLVILNKLTCHAHF